MLKHQIDLIEHMSSSPGVKKELLDRMDSQEGGAFGVAEVTSGLTASKVSGTQFDLWIRNRRWPQKLQGLAIPSSILRRPVVLRKLGFKLHIGWLPSPDISYLHM